MYGPRVPDLIVISILKDLVPKTSLSLVGQPAIQGLYGSLFFTIKAKRRMLDSSEHA